ncbi:hypothetical protein TOPH_07684 [Tolypocladium ophioglossoides CBS 100239]|uniref:Uncharacterized protein n=1 Tax=Tolypocladium ophioglossoides (strain CBS 100239) TaxID=1163406 RepID=A0A0L0N0S6_TOLOC|nr:hypothetical protein TOPH_07684 [Tolypocladium ophioglossoides CBS 100239]
MTGTRLGMLSHDRWFQLRGLSRNEQKQEIERLSWEYAWFGTATFILELIPFLSLFFHVTNTAGSAMWASRMEGG